MKPGRSYTNPPRWKMRFGLAGLLLCGLFAWPLPEAGLKGRAPLELFDRRGKLLRQFREPGAGSFREDRPLNEFPPALVQAVLAAEDRRFYRHPGVDPLAIVRALMQNLAAGRILSGASTISQQTARIAFASQMPRRLGARKAVELWYALRLEVRYSKQEILTAYLNRVPLPANRAGFPAAARELFERDLSLLIPAESTALAVLVRRHRLRPAVFRKRFLHLAAFLEREHGLQVATDPATLDRLETRLIASPARGAGADAGVSRGATGIPAEDTPHFVDYLRKRFPGLGGRVHTEISAELNHRVAAVLDEELAILAGQQARDGAVVVLEIAPERDQVFLRALVGSRDFQAAGTGQVNAATATRQAGSSLKPFVYGLAMDRLGLRPYSLLRDEDLSIPLPDGGSYRPRNYDLNFRGRISLREALATSRNVPAVVLVHEMGSSAFFQFLRRAGLRHLEGQAASRFGPGLALGGSGITLLDLTRLFAALPMNGMLYPVTLGRGAGGRTIEIGPRRRLLSPRTALQLTHVLADRNARQSSFGRLSFLDFPFAVAAKTGTSKDYRDAWTVGYTPRFVVGVWVGNVSGESMNQVSGAEGAGRVFQQVMRRVAGVSSPDFRYPDDWQVVRVCRHTSKIAGSFCPVQDELLAAGDPSPGRCSGLHRLVDGSATSDWTSPSENAPGENDFQAAATSFAVRESIVLSPVAGEVFLLDPHSPREIQFVPLKLRAPERERLRFQINEGPARWFSGEYNSALDLGVGAHRLSVFRGGRLIEVVEFRVEQ